MEMTTPASPSNKEAIHSPPPPPLVPASTDMSVVDMHASDSTPVVAFLPHAPSGGDLTNTGAASTPLLPSPPAPSSSPDLPSSDAHHARKISAHALLRHQPTSKSLHDVVQLATKTEEANADDEHRKKGHAISVFRPFKQLVTRMTDRQKFDMNNGEKEQQHAQTNNIE